MLRFTEWVLVAAPEVHIPMAPWINPRQLFSRIFEAVLHEARDDNDVIAFVQGYDQQFKEWIKEMLKGGRFVSPMLQAEAMRIVDGNSGYSYGQELLKKARSSGRLSGFDLMDAATEVGGQLWEEIWHSKNWPPGMTWDEKFSKKAEPGNVAGNVPDNKPVSTPSIIGTLRAYMSFRSMNHGETLRRARRATRTLAQAQAPAAVDNVPDPDAVAPGAADVPSETRPQGVTDEDWEQWKQAIFKVLDKQMEVARHGPHAETRMRKFALAKRVVEKQMAIPWVWRDIRTSMNDDEEARNIKEGAAQQALANIIRQAKVTVLEDPDEGLGSEAAQFLNNFRNTEEGKALLKHWTAGHKAEKKRQKEERQRQREERAQARKARIRPPDQE